MRSVSRGYTLIEILIASAIGVLMLGTIYQLVILSRTAQTTAHQSFVLAEDLAAAFRTLQRELAETSLGSIEFQRTDQPLLTFLSAREESGLKIDPTGAPHWLKAVYYKLEPAAGNVGTLVRRERALEATALPYPGPVTLPLPEGAGRPVTQNILLPGFSVTGAGLAEVQADPKAPGGFEVGFVRREPIGESVSPDSPCARSDKQQRHWSEGSTGLVEIKLALLEKDSSTGQLGYLELRLRVRPAVP